MFRIRPSRAGTLDLDASKRQGGSANARPGYDSCMARQEAGAPKAPSLERAFRSETVKHYAETIFYIRGGGTGPAGPPRRMVGRECADRHGDAATPGPRRLRRDRRRSERDPDADGEDLAAKIVRVRRLLERWLADVLGLDSGTADEEAQRLASAVSERVADRLDERSGTRNVPHGNVVPGREPRTATSSRCRTCRPACPRGCAASRRSPSTTPTCCGAGRVQASDRRAARGAAGRSAASRRSPVDVGGVTRPIGTSVGRLISVEQSPRGRPRRLGLGNHDRRLTARAHPALIPGSSSPHLRGRMVESPRTGEEDAMGTKLLAAIALAALAGATLLPWAPGASSAAGTGVGRPTRRCSIRRTACRGRQPLLPAAGGEEARRARARGVRRGRRVRDLGSPGSGAAPSGRRQPHRQRPAVHAEEGSCTSPRTIER